MAEPRANRLKDETSPYLLQHAQNPVDWYPWGPEALGRARDEDKPILLSIGYSACHWCHVMERESFEDHDVAAFMNEHFVSIKVDREERPDLDDIYMKFVTSYTGSGGWPMNVWLTPDLHPFFGGTYFPPDNRYGRASFMQTLDWLVRGWTGNRGPFIEQSEKFVEHLRDHESADASGELDANLLDQSLASLGESFDPEWGGFGSAPKFPHAMDIRIAFRHHQRTGSADALKMASHTLDCMARGGIYDQIGGGFARYSTDERWLIPHFEKMLYDNALLVPAYLDAFLVTGDERFARVARETCDWVLREMATPEGGFGSALDADSEGEEGKFYVWTPAELRAVLGQEQGARAAAWFGVTDGGNFEHGASALWRRESAETIAAKSGVGERELETEMRAAGATLLAARADRIRPGYDDKVLVAWNGMMISAMALTSQVLDDERYLDAARKACRYILDEMRQPDGRLFATARHGRAHLNAYLDDYAFLIAGLLDLYETDFDTGWIDAALALNTILTERFEDSKRGGYFNTGTDHETLIVRTRSTHDQATPAGSGVQALNLLRLGALTDDPAHRERAVRTIRSLAKMANRIPGAFSQLLLAVDWLRQGSVEVVIAGEPGANDTKELLRGVRSTFRPQRVVALNGAKGSTALPLFEGRGQVDGKAAAYVCQNQTCLLPTTDPIQLMADLVRR